LRHSLDTDIIDTRTPPVEAHRPVVTYLIYSFQFRPAFRATITPSQPDKAPTSMVTDTLVVLTVVQILAA